MVLPPALLLLPLLLVQLYYGGRYFRPFARRPPEPGPDAGPGPDAQPVSVLVCAHNEAENLPELLPQLLAQDYPPGFEVLLVDDRSHDGTAALAREFRQLHPGRFRVVTVAETPAGLSPKKYALTLGIRAARHARLLLTDADCRPAGPAWLALMQRGFGGGADLVLGYSGYRPAPGLLNQLVRYETLLTAAQYLAFAWAGKPYMGVGRNLAYTKSLFLRTKGFATHLRRLSGDDDLLVQDAVARGARVAVVADAPAHTLSRPPGTWRAWWRQKRRHLSAGPAYRPADRRRLARFMGANLLWYLLTPAVGLAAPASAENLVTLGLLWLARSVWLTLAYAPLARRLGAGLAPAALPLLDFIYFSFYGAWGLSLGLFPRRPATWK